jgi:PAS domain S-box-containing protein
LPILLTTIHEGRILEANESALRLFEYTREEILGKTTPELNIWPDLESRKNTLQEILKEPLGSNHEIQYYTKSRRPITCLITAVQIEYNGEPCILTMSMDITERKTREELLRENEDRFRYIIQHDYNGIAVLDYQERILFVSERFLEDFHLKDRSIIGKPFRESFPEISPRWRDLVRRVLAGAVERCDEDFLRTPEGGVEYFRWECRPYYTKPDVIGGMVLYSEIITQRKERENQLEAIASITEALRNAVSQKEIYPILLDQVQSILHTDAVAVILRIRIASSAFAWQGGIGNLFPVQKPSPAKKFATYSGPMGKYLSITSSAKTREDSHRR